MGGGDIDSTAPSSEVTKPSVSPELHALLVSIIEDITSARDKMGPIRKLHVLIKKNPSLDVSLYLQRISSVFRKFVLDTLTKLDQQGYPESSAEIMTTSVARHGNSENTTISAPTSKLVETNRGDDIMSGSEGFEAMRIIEGLKSHHGQPASSPRLSTSANRAAIHNKVNLISYVLFLHLFVNFRYLDHLQL